MVWGRNTAGRIGITDRTPIEPDQPAGIVAAARNAAGRIGIADRASIIVSDQPADIVAARNAAGRIGIADRPSIIVPDQPAHSRAARDAAALKADIAQDGPGTGISEQANMLRIGTIDRQPADHMPDTIKRAGETRNGSADWHEAASTPDAGAICRAVGRAGVDIAGKPVACRKIGAHQRQLVQVGNRDHAIHRRSRLGTQDRAHVTRLIPGVGKIPTAVGAGRARVGSAQPDYARSRGIVANALRYASRISIEIGIGEERGLGLRPHKPADITDTRDTARRIGLRDIA